MEITRSSEHRLESGAERNDQLVKALCWVVKLHTHLQKNYKVIKYPQTSRHVTNVCIPHLLEALRHRVEALGVRVERVENVLHVEAAAHVFEEDAHEPAVFARRRAAHELREDGALAILRALRVRERESVQLDVELREREPVFRRRIRARLSMRYTLTHDAVHDVRKVPNVNLQVRLRAMKNITQSVKNITHSVKNITQYTNDFQQKVEIK